jgi:hypothetical protein
LLAQTTHNEWVVDFVGTDYMAKDVSPFSSLDVDDENNICEADNFALDSTGHGHIACRYGQIVNMYHVPSTRVNLLSVSQLIQTGNIF